MHALKLRAAWHGLRFKNARFARFAEERQNIPARHGGHSQMIAFDTLPIGIETPRRFTAKRAGSFWMGARRDVERAFA